MQHPWSSKPKPATFTDASSRSGRAAQRGVSLIELIVFIVIVSLALAGILGVYNQAVRGSADPMARKQAVSVAESLLTEAMMRPFTYCDPQDPVNDPSATPPTSGASCTGGAGGTNDQNAGGGALGPRPAGETRYSATNPFDNVADYNGLSMAAGIYSVDDGTTPMAGLSGYTAQVAVTRSGGTFGLSADEVLRIDVTVQGRGETITLTGYRFRYAPLFTG
jgi:MSHA pilin protein MshD